MEYRFREIEKKWQDEWARKGTFRATLSPGKPKYYVLDMFPYPSGAGLHVGHPLGYIASDIVARYKRICGFEVLHPMGFDSFGLPAEQYAIQTGQHPAVTTRENISRYREQLDKLGFSFDWEREVRTSDPAYYKWTQWIFIRLFHSWYDNHTKQAASIESLAFHFTQNGTKGLDAACSAHEPFTSEDWKNYSEQKQQEILMHYRLAYIGESMVNWCPVLGTVLANEEVKDGLSERGGYPVERKLMPQWSLRITAYAERLLEGLEEMEWSESLKELQRNWIGKSEGCSIRFLLEGREEFIEIFTTRPDTIFGATFLALAPEHELINKITTSDCRAAVESYVATAKNKPDRERMAETRRISGQFTGSYALHPFTGERIPVWTGDYVLAGYGTGAVMAVPGHDSRDHAFASHFGLQIKPVIRPLSDEHLAGKTLEEFILSQSYDQKEGTLVHSEFLNGLLVKEAIRKVIEAAEAGGFGTGKTLYRLRDAIFGRQRYWGEPIPVYYRDGIPYTLPEERLPLVLPEIDSYLPTESGEPPLARAGDNWKYEGRYEYEHTTMPGWAGSSWYFLRYTDTRNDREFASTEALDYWKEVDLYIGGSEHATGHLLYFRFWTKFLYDLGYIRIQEPARKLINQGMIQGVSCFIYRVQHSNRFVSHGLKDLYDTTAIHIDVKLVQNNQVVDTEALRQWREEFRTAEFELENGELLCGTAVEKMSKRWHNVVNPDDICEEYGADCLRLYEMFLGPLDQSKPWNTNGITGVFNFLKKFWRLFFHTGEFYVSQEEPTAEELKVLHKTIKKISEDMERLSFNTSVSTFMICVNELTDLRCNRRAILEPLVIILSPFAPHLAEELWNLLGHDESIRYASFPAFRKDLMVENSFEYPVSINGKTRFKINLSLQFTPAEVEKEVLTAEELKKWLNGNKPKKIIVVPGRIVNVVI